MNMNSTVASSLIRIVKTEPGIILDRSDELVGQKEEYEQKINRLQQTHNEQILKLCHELEKSSVLIHQLKLERDSMRISLNQKMKTQTNQSSVEDLQSENSKLKKELARLTINYQTLFNEMQEARQYLLNMIENLN